MLTFDEFAAGRKYVTDIGEELQLTDMNGTAGYVYEHGYIERNGDAFLLVIANQDWFDPDLSKLERILYDNWYVPENSEQNLADRIQDAPNPQQTGGALPAAAPDLVGLTKTIARLRKVHSAATVRVSGRDPERLLAKNADLEKKRVPFTMYDVDWDTNVVKPVTITRFGINTAAGATAPSVSVTYADGSKALASAGMFYMRQDWAQAQADHTKAETAREAAKQSFMKLAYKTMPSLLDAAEAFVNSGTTLTNQVQEQAAEIARLRAVVDEVHSWIVCAAITTPQDMAGNFTRIEQITSPSYKGDDPTNLFEVTAFGFDGGTDATDDRVLWVTAPSIEVVQAAVEGLGASVEPMDHDLGEVMDDLDFELPGDIEALQEKCRYFQAHDAAERTSPDHKGDDSPRLYEVTAFGFDGGTDETDDRILWVRSPSIALVEAAVGGTGAKVALYVDGHDRFDPMVVNQDVDFELPQDTTALQEKCQHFQTCDEVERIRRIQELPKLNKSAGAAYTFLQVANKAMGDAAAAKGEVDWHQVESDAIQASVFQHGQMPSAIENALLRYSPGAVGVGRRGSIAERVSVAEDQLHEASRVRGPSEPTI